MELISKRYNKINVFISSVFYEDNNEWQLRRTLAEKLRKANYNTWLWEEDGEKEQKKGKCWLDIIPEAINNSDLLITFYKSRAGNSDWFNKIIPFLPTDYEIALAIKYGVPLKIYFINNKIQDDNLKGVKALYAESIIIGDKPTYCINEEDFINKVLHDIHLFSLSGIATLETSLMNLPCTELQSNDIELMQFLISSQINSGDYLSGHSLVKVNLDIDSYFPITKEEKVLKARSLAIHGNVYANRKLYLRAIRLVLKSIRLFMEVGEWNEMFGQIQALSGIQNMAGIKTARFLNAYGIRSTQVYKNLAQGYNDSKASIYRDLGLFDEALKLCEPYWEDSTYSAAKYAHLLSQSSRKNGLNDSRKLMEDEIIPRARSENNSLSYVLNEASIIAIGDNDISSANKYLNESETICDKLGLLHTKKRISQIRKRIPN